MRYISNRFTGLKAGDKVTVSLAASCRARVFAIAALDVEEGSENRFITSPEGETFFEKAGVTVQLMQRGERVFD